MTKPLQGTLRLSAEERAALLDEIENAERVLELARDALDEEKAVDPNRYMVSRYDGPARLEYVRQRLRHNLRCAKSGVKRALLLLTAYEYGIARKEGDRHGDPDPPVVPPTSDVSK